MPRQKFNFMYQVSATIYNQWRATISLYRASLPDETGLNFITPWLESCFHMIQRL